MTVPVSRRKFLQATAAAFCLTKAGFATTAAGTGLSRLPYLQRLLVDRASILWTTAQPVAGSVVVIAPDGTQASFSAVVTEYDPSSTQMPATYYQYQADITGLRAGVDYRYQVVLDGQTVATGATQYTFTTPTAGAFSFLAFGDSGADSPEQLALIQSMSNEPGISQVLHLGDLAYDSGTFAEFEANYFGLNAGLMSRLPFFATPGNHEYVTNNAAPYLAGHVAPAGDVASADLGRYYSYDRGDAHFVSIDSNLLETASATRMLSWLDKDLAATGKYWKIVFLHHPPYPTGAHLNDPVCALVQKNVTPIVERHGVQLVLSGHEHGYERSFPLVANQAVSAGTPSTTYVISGGGGASMETVGSLPQCALSVQAFHYLRVDVDGPALTFKAIRSDGTVVDMVTLQPPPVIAPNGIANPVNAASAVYAGSVVGISGQSLAVRAVASVHAAGSGELDGITVSANGQPVRLVNVSPTQIAFHMPVTISGEVDVQVTTPNGSTSAVVTVAPYAAAPVAPVRR